MNYDDLKWIDELRANYRKIQDSYVFPFWGFFLVTILSLCCITLFEVNHIIAYVLFGVSIGCLTCMALIFYRVLKIEIHMHDEINERLGIKK